MSFSLEDAPSYVAGYLGITEDTAAVLLSACVIMAFVLPVALLTKDRMQMIIALFLGSTICVGIAWLPFWVLIMFVVIFVAGFAMFTAGGVTGGNG